MATNHNATSGSNTENSIQFADIFDLNEIQRLQDLFADTHGVASIITQPDGTPITNPSNFTRLCFGIIRKTEQGCAHCFKSDALLGRHNPSGPIVQPCLSGGLWDAGASITVGGIHIANWLIGQVRNNETDRQQMLAYADKIGANRDDFMKALDEVPEMSSEQFHKVANLLFAFANELSEKAYTNMQLKAEIAVNDKASRLLKESEEKYRLLVENQSDLLVKVDQKGRFLYVSPSYCSLFERSEAELIGASYMPLVHPDDIAPTQEAMKKLYKPPYNCQIEQRAMTKNGWRWLSWVDTAELNSNNEVMSIVGVGRDITDRKYAELALKEAEERWRLAVSSSPIPIMIHDDEDNILQLSQGWTNFSGYTIDDIPTLSDWTERAYGERSGSKKEYIDQLFSINQTVYNGEWIVTTKDGGTRIWDFQTTPLGKTNEGKRVLNSLAIDITDRKYAEQALTESEAKYRLLTENIKDVVWVLDVDIMCYKYISPSVQRLLGYKPEEIMALPISATLMPDNAEEVLFLISSRANDFKAGKITPDDFFVNEVVQSCKDGSTVWTEIITSLYINPESGRVEIRGVSRNITERKQSEEIIKKMGQHFKALIEKAPDGIVLIDATGNFNYASPSALKMFGYNDIDNKTLHPDELTHPDDLPMVLTELGKLMHDPTYVPTLQYRFREGNGGWKWIESTFTNLLSDSSVESIVINFRNITERKLAEEALLESERALKLQIGLLSSLLKNIQIGVFMVEVPSGKPLVANDTALKLLGRGILPDASRYNLGEVYKAFKLSNGNPYPLDEMPITRAFNGEISHVDDMLVEHPDGTRKLLEVFGMPVTDEQGNIWASLVSFFDITERKEAEQLLKEKTEEIETQNEEYLQLNEELSQINEELIKAKEKAEESDRLKTAFLQNMSHEIRTPMNAIMGFSELLLTSFDDKQKLEKYVGIIAQRCADLLEIINDILDIAKIESGQLTVNIEKSSLKMLFGELTLFFREHQKRQNKQQIEFNMHNGTTQPDIMLSTDIIKLKQIFINLIGNAFKFTDVGKIEAGCMLDANNALLFYVSDTGIGIPVDKHQMVFDRFTQINQEKTRLHSGTGLGLSIVKGLVNLLGGQIWLESEPGKGSTFYFTIATAVNHSEQSPVTVVEQPSDYHFTNKTILIVEDDSYNAEFIQDALADVGLTIEHTTYGKEAVQLSQTKHIDLVLMDIRLPDIDGYEASRLIRKHNPEAKIIVQTAFASSDEKEKAMAAGCVDFISKPIKQTQLLSIINKYL